MTDPPPPPSFLTPGALARRSGTLLPLFDDPRMAVRTSAQSTRWAPKDALLLVLAVVHGEGGHEHAMVLYGEGHTGWCWGGYLEPEPD